MEIKTFRTPGLGDATYLIVHEGTGLLVDPQRDVDRFLATVEGLGAQVRFVLETHIHNDYVSGGREVASLAGAALVVPAAAGVAFDHVPAFHLEDIDAGTGLSIRPIHTPGHTPEHVSYLILIDGEPRALFSGGSLLVGAAGRTDLLGQARARQLAILQHGSVQRLASLPGDVELYPTHGAGSFCAAGPTGKSMSTIQLEREYNPALAHTDGPSFAQAQLADLQPYPQYFAFMGGINLLGPSPMPKRDLPTLVPADVVALCEQVRIVDARPRADFAAGHIPGAVGIELGDDFGVWTGWLLPFNGPLALVMNEDQDLNDAVTQLAQIGFEDVRGVLRGVFQWEQERHPLAEFKTVTPEQFAAAVRAGAARQILDVRSPAEWQADHLPQAIHGYVPDLADRIPPELAPEEPVWIACASGYRAAIAAGLVERGGFRPVVLARGGVPDLLHLLSDRDRPTRKKLGGTEVDE